MPNNFKCILYILLASLCLAFILPAEQGLCRSRLIQKRESDKPRRVESSVLTMKGDEDEEIIWNLSADKVTSLNEANIVEAEGQVELRRGNEYLKADFARYFLDTKWVYLKGDVEIFMGRDNLTAKEAEFDLANRTGWLKDGEVFMGGPHIIFKGEQIQKHWGDVYSFRNAKVTACDGPVPAWSMTAEEAVVEIDGYARLWNTSFNIKDQAVMYSPVMLLPAKKNRQSGFLTPEYGYSSRKGVGLDIPYFWAIDESQDLTVNTNIMFERGVMPGLQYRATPNSDSKYWIMGDWMRDSKTVDSTGSSLYRGDNLMRTNYDRWWLRGMADTRLPDPRWRVKADLDLVSDQEFLQEFRRGRNGFYRSRDDLFDIFKRDIREKDDPRETGLMIERDWERFGFNSGFTYTQNQYYGHGNAPGSDDITVQRVPELNAFIYPGRVIQDMPLEFEAQAQAVYFNRRKGTRGSRLDLAPKVVVPLSSKYGAVISSFGVRQTNYATEYDDTSWIQRDDGSVEKGKSSSNDSRTIPELDIAGSTDFMRVFNLDSKPVEVSEANSGQGRWTAVRHSVQPRVGYRNAASVNQDDLPYYDEEDRIHPRNELYYSVTNVLTRKRESVVVKQDKSGELVPELETDYLDFVRLRLEQAYDIREADRSHHSDYTRRPFSDLLTDLTISPTSLLSFYSRVWWELETGDVTKLDQGLRLNYADWGNLSAGFHVRKAIDEYKRQRKNNLRYAYINGDFNIGGPWVVGFSYARDIAGNSDVEKAVAIGYRHQCFLASAEVSVEPDETSFQLFIELAGLGD